MEQLGAFLDVSSALQYCCDSEELYLDIVGTYLEEDRYGLISEYFAAMIWRTTAYRFMR